MASRSDNTQHAQPRCQISATTSSAHRHDAARARPPSKSSIEIFEEAALVGGLFLFLFGMFFFAQRNGPSLGGLGPLRECVRCARVRGSRLFRPLSRRRIFRVALNQQFNVGGNAPDTWLTLIPVSHAIAHVMGWQEPCRALFKFHNPHYAYPFNHTTSSCSTFVRVCGERFVKKNERRSPGAKMVLPISGTRYGVVTGDTHNRKMTMCPSSFISRGAERQIAQKIKLMTTETRSLPRKRKPGLFADAVNSIFTMIAGKRHSSPLDQCSC